MDKYVFGITGPTGAGKSTVSDMLRQFGVYVADADKVSREVVKKGEKCLDEISTSFGDEVLKSNGDLDRKKLAEIVFSDSTKLKLLNSITHKYIKEYLIKEIENTNSKVAAIDGAVIIGSPVMEMCKKMIVVTADRKTRIKRIMKRDGIDEVTALKRISSQMSDREYQRFADYIIENNDENVRLGECVENIYNEIKIVSQETAAQKSQKAQF